MSKSSNRQESADEVACKLHVRMLPTLLDDLDVYRIFSSYGIVHDIRMPPPASKTMKTRFAFVTYTRASMADLAKRSLDGVTRVTTEHADLTFDSPLRVDVYVPYEQLPAKVTPLLPANAQPPKPLLVRSPPLRSDFQDFKSMSAMASAPSERQLPPAPVTMASRVAKPKDASAMLDGKAILKRDMLSIDEPTAVTLASFRTPYDMHVRLKSSAANFDGVFSQLQRSMSLNMPPLTIVAVHCSPRAKAIDGSLTSSEGEVEMVSLTEEWHRALIVSAEVLPMLSNTRYVCRLFDTGHTVRVTHELVRPLPPTAAFLGAQAVHVALAGVRPNDGAHSWSANVSTVCRDWLTNVNADLKVVVVDGGSDDNIYWPLKQLVRFVSHGDLFANNVALLDSVLVAEGLAVKAVLDEVPTIGAIDKAKSYTRRGMLACRPTDALPPDESMAAVIEHFNAMLVDAV